MLKIYFPISALFNLVTSLAIGLFVFLKNWRAKANQGFFLFALSVAFWAFGYFRWQIATNQESALFWSRVLTAGAIWITPWYYYFVIKLLALEQKKYRVIFNISIVLAGIFTFFNITSGLLVKSTRPILIFPFWPVPGILYILYLATFLFYAIYATLLLWYEYKKGSDFRKRQIRYVFLGTAIGYFGGCTNYPQWYGIAVLPWGNILVGLYPILVGYSIIKYRLFEIDTVIHRTILWILTSCSILIPIGISLYFTRDWLASLNWIQLTFITTGLFYLFLYYYFKMQPKIDHVFRRRKYDYYKVLGEIAQKIGSELDIGRVTSRLFKELKEVLYIRNGILFVQPPGQLDYTETGSIGYETLAGFEKREKVFLAHDNSLSQWVNQHQRALEREQVEVDPQYSPIRGEAMEFFGENSIELFIPVIMENKVNGMIGIGKKENLQAYTLKDIELLEHMGRQTGITIDNALHHEDIVEKERLAQELKLGREIQTALLPQETPEIQGIVVQGLMRPAKEIGGDYYDFITLPQEGQLAVVIGDVSGKGVAAGLLMAMAKTAIHTLSQEETSPKQILLRTNAILNQHIGGQKFMTLLYLKWHPHTKTMFYSAAGHEHILLYRNATQNLETIQSGGFMLGMLPDIETFLEEREFKLQSGDKILLYTDGITEAENQSGDRFGLERLKVAFIKYSEKPANELMQAIRDEVYSFIGTHPQYDDITLVALEAT